MISLCYRVPPRWEGASAQDYLRREQGWSTTLIRSVKQVPGGFLQNGVPARMPDILRAGDILRLTLPADSCRYAPNPALSAPIVLQDAHLAVYDKPPGMPVHPSHGHREDTLLNLYAAQYPGEGFHPVNRLDGDTSGLCVIARHPLAAFLLPQSLKKEYLAIACGLIPWDKGVIDAPIAREPESAVKRRVSAEGKQAVTRYRVGARTRGMTLLRVRIDTGRTHQIRVHFAHLGCPLAGDGLYGGSQEKISRQALHCARIAFIHPVTHIPVCFKSPLPKDMRSLLK